MHPFTPFITEEIWHWLKDREDGQDIIISEWPKAGNINDQILKEFDIASSAISNIRNLRKQNNIANKVAIELSVKLNADHSKDFDPVIIKLGNVSNLEYVTDKITNSFSFIEQNNEYFIPFGDDIDVGVEKEKIEDELEYTKGSLAIVQKKLSNDRFVNNAPNKVVEMERKKEEDALNKIKILEGKLAEIN
jgi:valyl-tRNA synthetase